MEALEREEEEAGARITVKKKKGGKGKSSFRQTKLNTGGEKNSMEVTKPSPFAEAIEPNIPEFNANPKKPGAGRKRIKAEPTEKSDASPNKGSEGGEKEGEVAAKKQKTELVEGEEEEGKSESKPATVTVAAKKRSKTVKVKELMDEDSEMEIWEESDDTDVSNYL